jgi:hypothetical protein
LDRVCCEHLPNQHRPTFVIASGLLSNAGHFTPSLSVDIFAYNSLSATHWALLTHICPTDR